MLERKSAAGDPGPPYCLIPGSTTHVDHIYHTAYQQDGAPENWENTSIQLCVATLPFPPHDLRPSHSLRVSKPNSTSMKCDNRGTQPHRAQGRVGGDKKKKCTHSLCSACHTTGHHGSAPDGPSSTPMRVLLSAQGGLCPLLSNCAVSPGGERPGDFDSQQGSLPHTQEELNTCLEIITVQFHPFSFFSWLLLRGFSVVGFTFLLLSTPFTV